MIQCIATDCDNKFKAVKNNGYVRKYCSRSCANRRRFSKESKQRIAEGMRAYFKGLSHEDEMARREKLSRIMKQKFLESIKDMPFEELGDTGRRQRIIDEQNGCCGVCGMKPIWNSEPLKFQLDHVNGDRTNNTRQNLRLICANCHSQTPTYGRPKGITNKQINALIVEGLNNNQVCNILGINASKTSYKRINKLREIL